MLVKEFDKVIAEIAATENIAARMDAIFVELNTCRPAYQSENFHRCEFPLVNTLSIVAAAQVIQRKNSRFLFVSDNLFNIMCDDWSEV